MSDRKTCRICRKPLANEEDVRTWEKAFNADDPEDIPDEQTYMIDVCWSEQCGEHTDADGQVIEDVEEHLIARADAAEAEVKRLRGAIEPFAHYLQCRDAKPLRGLANVIHSIHAGTPYEAEITMGDIRLLVSAINNMQARALLAAKEEED